MTTESTTFHSMPTRVAGELADRQDKAKRALRYYNTFLDDYLRGIMPNDLVILGAPSGVGKTDLSLSIATSNAFYGKPVHYFALEAEERELERRTKYTLLSREAHKARHPEVGDLNYTDWYLGRCEHIVGEHNRTVDQMILEQLGKMHTLYRGSRFDHKDLVRWILEVHERTQLIIVDHLHYIDTDDQLDENRGLHEVVKTVRDVSLRIGKPIILVAHLRKRDPRMKQLLATLDDFHGSSNVGKICTQAITFEPAPPEIVSPKWFLAPTLMSIQKDRRSGAPRVVALMYFDIRTRAYQSDYTLGRIKGSKWEQIEPNNVPRWARHHKPLETI